MIGSLDECALHRGPCWSTSREIVSGQWRRATRCRARSPSRSASASAAGSLRECLRALEERGLATVRHGSATIVNAREALGSLRPGRDRRVAGRPGRRSACSPSTSNAGGSSRSRPPASPPSARPPTAWRCWRSGSPRWRPRWRSAPARAQEAAFHEADVAFHTALVEVTGNLALLALVRRVDAALLAARYPLARPAYRRTRALPEHEAILAAVRARDAGGGARGHARAPRHGRGLPARARPQGRPRGLTRSCAERVREPAAHARAQRAAAIRPRLRGALLGGEPVPGRGHVQVTSGRAPPNARLVGLVTGSGRWRSSCPSGR